MILIGNHANGAYGRPIATNMLDIDVAVIASISVTSMTQIGQLGASGLYEVSLHGRSDRLRFMSPTLGDLQQDDIAYIFDGEPVAFGGRGKVHIFGQVLERAVCRGPAGAIASFLALLGLPFRDALVSNAIYQILTMQPEPITELGSIHGHLYGNADGRGWEPMADYLNRLKASSAIK